MITPVGRYDLQAHLGSGAFTSVYRAVDLRTGRTVAIRVPVEESEKDVFARLHQEAAEVHRLRHENIVTVYEWGEQDGTPFIAEEYLEGETLHEIISSRKALSLIQKVRIMMQVCDALNAAHKTAAIHLDLKPANIVVLPDGTAKVMDFGMVEVTAQMAERLRRQGYLDASVRYAAPEQLTAQGQESQATDIFPYGVIFYELLAGRHPFEAADATSMAGKIMHDEAQPLRAVDTSCPPRLEELIQRSLQKDPLKRFQSPENLQIELRSILADLRQDLEFGSPSQLLSQATSEPAPELTGAPAMRPRAVEPPKPAPIAAVAAHDEAPRPVEKASNGKRLGLNLFETGSAQNTNKGLSRRPASALKTHEAGPPWKRIAAWGLPLLFLATAAGGIYWRTPHRQKAVSPAPILFPAAAPAPGEGASAVQVLESAPSISVESNPAESATSQPDKSSPFAHPPEPQPAGAPSSSLPVAASNPDAVAPDVGAKPDPQAPAPQFDPSALPRRKLSPRTAFDSPPPSIAPPAVLQPGTSAQLAAGQIKAPPAPAPPPPAPAASIPPPRIRVGGQFREPKLITGPPAAIPQAARDNHISGLVRLEATVGKDGKVKSVKILSGHPVLSSAAREAAIQQRYQPATLNGLPIEATVIVEIGFKPVQ